MTTPYDHWTHAQLTATLQYHDLRLAHLVAENQRLQQVNSQLAANQDALLEQLHHTRYLAPDAKPGEDTGMTKEDYSELYARHPHLMDW